MMLDANPELAIPPESHFITPFARRFGRGPFDAPAFVEAVIGHHRFKQWLLEPDIVRAAVLDDPPASYADAIRRVYAAYATAQGKTRYGDKTPRYLRTVSQLATLFPESRFLHIVRDGRDVASALNAAEWGPRGLSEGALHWQQAVEKGWATARPLGVERYYEIKYEDLVRDPATVLEGVCRFIEVPFADAMLHPERQADDVLSRFKHPESHLRLRKPITQGVRDWRRDMADAHVELLEALIGDTLTAAGYDRRTPEPSAATRRRAAYTRVLVRGTGVWRRVVEGVSSRLRRKH